MRTFFFAVMLLWTAMTASGQNIGDTLIVSSDIKLVRLTENVYIHISEADMGRFGRVSSNGMIVAGKYDAVMVDTPVSGEQTEALMRFVEENLGVKISLLIATHWHDDCMGGIDFVHRYGALSLGHEKTAELAAEHGLTPPVMTFRLEQSMIFDEGSSWNTFSRVRATRWIISLCGSRRIRYSSADAW